MTGGGWDGEREGVWILAQVGLLWGKEPGHSSLWDRKLAADS